MQTVASLTCLTFVAVAADFRPFDDSVLFTITWQQSSTMPADLLHKFQSADNRLVDSAVVLSTDRDEQYLCQLPRAPESNRPRIDQYNGPTPADLLAPLYAQRSCTYRIEMYWTYELCHGRFLLQYHDEKDAVKGSSQRSEYYLGQYATDRALGEDAKFDHLNPPKRKVDDQLMAYYPVRYAEGTVCDITNKPRVTTVQYVCVSDGKNQIYSLDEVGSCEYEVVVLTARLCSHPAFQPDVPDQHDVACFPLHSAPTKPTALVEWDKEQKWDFQQQFASSVHADQRWPRKPTITPDPKKPTAIVDEDVDEDEGEEEEEATRAPPAPRAKPLTVTKATPPRMPMDRQLLREFLSGDYCLYGGAGWWKHEYCHGKQVLQFHEDAQVGRQEIVLGIWDQAEHLSWIALHPHKKPVKVDGKIRQVSQWFVRGDLCDETKAHRTVEVRLRCRESAGNPNAVTLYLLEPRTCDYILGVESAMLCELLQTVADDGLIPALRL